MGLGEPLTACGAMRQRLAGIPLDVLEAEVGGRVGGVEGGP